MDNTTQLFKQYFDTAPSAVQTIAKNLLKNPEKVAAIVTKNNIDPSKVDALQLEILFTLLGVSPISKFRANLVQELKITYDQALKIALDVHSQIFGPEIVDLLKNMEEDVKDFDGALKAIAEEGENDQSEQAAATTTQQTAPEKLLPDHQKMEKTDGGHLHSQTVMPTPVQNQPKPVFKSAPAPVKPMSGSIVDQKLSGMVRSSSNAGYKGNDPYREPLN